MQISLIDNLLPPQNLPQNWRMIKLTQTGIFYRSRNGLTVIITCCRYKDKNWVHLSVSRKNKMPTWDELVTVKDIFLGKESVAIQVFEPCSESGNFHAYCLHLWQCLDERPIPDFRIDGLI